MAALVGAGMVFWLGEADERRVDGACDTWLGQRGALRAVLNESEEAVGRAHDEHSSETATHFNDLDTTIAALQRWEDVSPDVIGSLDNSGDASALERGAVSAFDAVQTGLDELRRLIEQGEPLELASWVPEVGARFRMVDDTCLAAARRRTL